MKILRLNFHKNVKVPLTIKNIHALISALYRSSDYPTIAGRTFCIAIPLIEKAVPILVSTVMYRSLQRMPVAYIDE